MYDCKRLQDMISKRRGLKAKQTKTIILKVGSQSHNTFLCANKEFLLLSEVIFLSNEFCLYVTNTLALQQKLEIKEKKVYTTGYRCQSSQK